MEFLTESLKETVSKLSDDQKEEIAVVEAIVNTNETNKESMKEIVFRFVEKHEPENCINFIIGCIKHAVKIRPKERESLLFLLTSVFCKFKLNFEILRTAKILADMLSVKKIIPPVYCTNYYIFDFE